MKDLFGIIDKMIRQQSEHHPHFSFDFTNIKKCVKLLDEGWKLTEYRPIDKSTGLNLIFKLGDQEKGIKLNFSEQKVWLSIMEKRNELSRRITAI